MGRSECWSTRIGLSLSDAARMCSTTPAAAIKARGYRRRSRSGKAADLAVLSRDLRVVQTYIGRRTRAGNLDRTPELRLLS